MAAHIEGPLCWEQLVQSGHPMVFVHSNPMDHSCIEMFHALRFLADLGL